MKSLYQTPTFARKYKKLNKGDLGVVNLGIREFLESPEIGQVKKGDLKEFRVHKVKGGNNQLLIAYRSLRDRIELVDFGVHENFYRDLKRKR